MENTQEKPQRLGNEPASPDYLPRSPVVQKKLDETNAALAKLSQEDLDLLLEVNKKSNNLLKTLAAGTYVNHIRTGC